MVLIGYFTAYFRIYTKIRKTETGSLKAFLMVLERTSYE
jgi:hypothetical protein